MSFLLCHNSEIVKTENLLFYGLILRISKPVPAGIGAILLPPRQPLAGSPLRRPIQRLNCVACRMVFSSSNNIQRRNPCLNCFRKYILLTQDSHTCCWNTGFVFFLPYIIFQIRFQNTNIFLNLCYARFLFFGR